MTSYHDLAKADDASRVAAMRVFDTWEGYALDLIDGRKRELTAKIDSGGRLDATDAGFKLTALDSLVRQLKLAPEPEAAPVAENAPRKRGRPRKVVPPPVAVVPPAPAPTMVLPRTDQDRLLHRARVICTPGWRDGHGALVDGVARGALENFLAVVNTTDMNAQSYFLAIRQEAVWLKRQFEQAEALGRKALQQYSPRRMVA